VLMRIKVMLLLFLKSPHANDDAIRRTLLPALEALGATQAAEFIIKSAAKSGAAEAGALSRPRTSEAPAQETGSGLGFAESKVLADRFCAGFSLEHVSRYVIGRLERVTDAVPQEDKGGPSGPRRDPRAKDPRLRRDPRQRPTAAKVEQQIADEEIALPRVTHSRPSGARVEAPAVVAPRLKPAHKSRLYTVLVKNVLRFEGKSKTASKLHDLLVPSLICSDSGTDEMYEMAVGFICENFGKRIELALQLLNREAAKCYKSEDPQWKRYDGILLSFTEKAIQELNRGGAALLRKLFTEVPVLNQTMLDKLQLVVMEINGAVALATFSDVITLRGSVDRDQYMTALLDYTKSSDVGYRGPAIRLVCDILFQNPTLAVQIIEFAEHSLQECTESSDEGLFLYLSLVEKQLSLLEGLVTFYNSASGLIQEKIETESLVLVQLLRTDNDPFINVIQNSPPSNLIFSLLDNICSTAPVPERIVGACLEKYDAVKDLRFIIPVLGELDRIHFVGLLPQLLVTDLSGGFSSLLGKILGPASRINPDDVLVELHLIDHVKQSVPLEKVLEAIKACFEAKALFKQEIIAGAMQKLVERNPIPPLYLRTTIQALKYYPKLQAFVLSVLSRLIEKEIWKSPLLWKGFLKCCQETLPKSVPVILQLPPEQLQNALSESQPLRKHLKTYVAQSRNPPVWLTSIIKSFE